ncbi:MAG: serine O-acetyltransferase EpsC [Armatimonadota bacterium]
MTEQQRYPLGRCETCEARDVCACRGPAQLSCWVVDQLFDSFGEDGIDTPEEVGTPVPSRGRVLEALYCIMDVLFPGRMHTELEIDASTESFVEERLARAYRLIGREIARALPFRWTGAYARAKGETEADEKVRETAALVVNRLMGEIPRIRELLVEDVQAAYNGDPAAHTYAEIMLSYPGLQAITVQRIAHVLYNLHVPLIPRIMTEWAHTTTGIDIHPGAQIGRSFFIDHGTGVVIGETCEIGDNVKLYQGVTLGALSFPLDEDGNPIKDIKRHPTLEENVVVYAGATILGGDTVIGRGSVIGSNVWLGRSVPPGSTVTQGNVEVKVKRNEE